MKSLKLLFYIGFLTLLSYSCIPYKKTLLLKEYNKDTLISQFKLNFDSADYRVKVGDLIDIKVSSPDKESVDIFNKSENRITARGEERYYLSSYLVEKTGEINFPLLGKISVVDKTVSEISDMIQERLSESYFKYVLVTARMVSFNITFIGEVTRPSSVPFYGNRINFFQALSDVGGLTLYANTKRVKILRKIDRENVKIMVLDISSEEFLESEYFYLQPNDIIYIEPLRAKSLKNNLSVITVASSVVSFTLLILRLIDTTTK